MEEILLGRVIRTAFGNGVLQSEALDEHGNKFRVVSVRNSYSAEPTNVLIKLDELEERRGYIEPQLRAELPEPIASNYNSTPEGHLLIVRAFAAATFETASQTPNRHLSAWIGSFVTAIRILRKTEKSSFERTWAGNCETVVFKFFSDIDFVSVPYMEIRLYENTIYFPSYVKQELNDFIEGWWNYLPIGVKVSV